MYSTILSNTLLHTAPSHKVGQGEYRGLLSSPYGAGRAGQCVTVTHLVTEYRVIACLNPVRIANDWHKNCLLDSRVNQPADREGREQDKALESFINSYSSK